MASYYIETVNGRRGPYTAEDITRGVRKGTVPLGARLVDESGNAVTPAEVIRAGQPQTAPDGQAGVQTPALPGVIPSQYPQQPAYTQQPGYPYPGNAGQYAPQPQAFQPYGQPMPYQPHLTPPTSGLAITSLVLSLVTLTFCLPLWIGGIICGIMALSHTQPNGPKSGRGLALAGIWSGVVIGFLYLICVAWFITLWHSDQQSW